MSKREPNARGEGDQLRQELVAAASELLLAPQAIALPSLRAVARACSVSPAAVYLHFDSQQELIAAVIRAQLGRLREYVHAAVAAQEAPVERLRALGVAYAEWGLAHPGAYQLLFESADQLGIASLDDDESWDLIREAGELTAEVTSATADDARLAAFRMWTALHGLVSLRLHKVDAPWPSAVVDEVHDIVSRFSVPSELPA